MVPGKTCPRRPRHRGHATLPHLMSLFFLTPTLSRQGRGTLFGGRLLIAQFRPGEDRREVGERHVTVRAKTQPVAAGRELRNRRQLHGLGEMVVAVVQVYG